METTIIRTINKRLFEKVITKPFHPLYGTVVHIWDGQDRYFITNDLGVPIQPLNDLQINDLYERPE